MGCDCDEWGRVRTGGWTFVGIVVSGGGEDVVGLAEAAMEIHFSSGMEDPRTQLSPEARMAVQAMRKVSSRKAPAYRRACASSM
jgi:hypothetical protein